MTATKVPDCTPGIVSKYKWYGEDAFDDKPALQTGLRYNLPDIPIPGADATVKGLILDVDYFMPIGSGSEKATEVDYALKWGKTLSAAGPKSSLELCAFRERSSGFANLGERPFSIPLPGLYGPYEVGQNHHLKPIFKGIYGRFLDAVFGRKPHDEHSPNTSIREFGRQIRTLKTGIRLLVGNITLVNSHMNCVRV